MAFLADKGPKPPQFALGVPALWRPFRPADAEVAKFARYVAAVENPAGVLEDMAAGAVIREVLEALRTVYPAVYADVRQRLAQRLASHGSALDYRQRLSLGLRLNFPAAPSLRPRLPGSSRPTPWRSPRRPGDAQARAEARSSTARRRPATGSSTGGERRPGFRQGSSAMSSSCSCASSR